MLVNRLEPYLALTACFLVLMLGGGIAGSASSTGLALHGWAMAAAAGYGAFRILGDMGKARPDGPLEYNDDVIKFGILASLIWAIFGFGMGDWLAW